MAFSDTFEGAVTLPYGYMTEPVPSSGLTADAIDTADWSLARTAWWKVTVPDDHDPTHTVVCSAARSYISEPNDWTGARIIIWQGETRETAEALDWGGSERWMTFDPGEVFYIEVGMWDDDFADSKYVVSVSEVYDYYTPYVQGPDVIMDPAPGTHVMSDMRQERVSDDAESPPFMGAVGPEGDPDAAINIVLLDLNTIATLTYSTSGMNSGSLVGEGGFGSVYETTATTPTGEDTWTGTGVKDDIGAWCAPYLNDFKIAYPNTVLPEDTTGLQWVELEGGLFSSDWQVTSVNATIPLLHGASYGGTARLYVRTYVRPSSWSGDDTGVPELIDVQMYEGGDNTPAELSFSTDNIKPATGGFCVFPIVDTGLSASWASEIPTEPEAGPTETRRVRYDVIFDASQPMLIGASLHPPRHRYRYRATVEPLPPITPIIAGQIGDTRRVFS